MLLQGLIPPLLVHSICWSPHCDDSRLLKARLCPCKLTKTLDLRFPLLCWSALNRQDVPEAHSGWSRNSSAAPGQFLPGHSEGLGNGASDERGA